MSDLKRVYCAVDEEMVLYELKNFAQNGIQNIKNFGFLENSLAGAFYLFQVSAVGKNADLYNKFD